MHISSADKKEKPWFLKALKTRRNPFFDKTVRKTGFIHYTIDEHITVADFCNLFFRLVFTRNLVGRFNQICHDLIELRDVF